jgi:hypothetical protein
MRLIVVFVICYGLKLNILYELPVVKTTKIKSDFYLRKVNFIYS